MAGTSAKEVEVMSRKRKTVSLMELADKFPNEESARKWFERRTWPDGERWCPRCGCGNTRRASHRAMPYWCPDRRSYFCVRIAFHGLPKAHDGARLFGFQIVFSEEFEGLRLAAFDAGALEVTNGRLVDAKRVTQGENRRVAVRVRPSSGEEMTLTLPGTTDCAAAGAICANDGRMLSGPVSATVTGPR